MDEDSSSVDEDMLPPVGGASGNPDLPPPPPPEEPPSEAPSAEEPRRWTCEACGCNTNIIPEANPDAERTCSVCGTSQSNGSALLRRAGYAARAGLFARTVAARRGFMNEELGGLDGYEFWSRAMEGDVDMDSGMEDDEHAIAALAMEVAGVDTRTGGDRGSFSSSGTGARSIMDAARSFAIAASNREAETRLEPNELWRAAEENGTLYQPKWMNPSQIGGRMRTGNGIEVGDNESQNVAYLPLGSGEGRALRALEAFPRSAPFASFNRSSENPERKPRRVFGFKVAFDHPKKGPGMNMGGSYLIGVTTTSFAAFSERNALQQSPFFWGIEDGGNKYEGARHHNGRDSHRRAGQSLYAVEVSPDEAPRNEDSVLFGSRQVITCIVDLEGRTLTFWRSEDAGEPKLLGTLVTGIPRGGQLYPIVVPYNAGSTVAITGMAGDPLPQLSSFVSEWKQAQNDKFSRQRQAILSQRSVLIDAGRPTSALVRTLRAIFTQYLSKEGSCLNNLEASRLWYRCGLRLSSLREIIDNKSEGSDGKKWIEFNDFLGLVERVISDDAKQFHEIPSDDENFATRFVVGGKVELVEGYERFGDAANGPLQPGDRGTVIELQKSSTGEITSVRVLHDGRRWWYQPNCVVDEKSGLVDSPGVWFLKRMLRLHGYHPVLLQLAAGNPVANNSWELGDLVVPKKMAKDDKGDRFGIDDAVGRIVYDSSSTGSLPPSSRGRNASAVMVEFVSPLFAEGASVQVGSSYTGKSLESRRIPISRLVHTSVFHGVDAAQQPRSGSLSAKLKKAKQEDFKEMDVDEESLAGNVDDYSLDGGVLSDLQGLKYLDPSAINRIIKECEKTSSSLNALFDAKLPTMALQALDCVRKNMQLAGCDESMAQALSSLGKLAILVARKSFPGECHLEELDECREPSANSMQSVAHRPVEENGSGGMDDEGADRSSTSRSQSLQERRRVLLSLMSRARRGDVGSLGELLSRDITGMPSLDISADAAAALFFGAPSEVNSFGGPSTEDRDNIRMENSRPNESKGHLQEIGDASNAGVEKTLLEDILRGRDGGGRVDTQAKWNVPVSSVKSIVAMGIAGNSLPWLKSLLSATMKKVPRKQSSREAALLKETTDEDGMPLLRLAISLGCTVDIVRCLIRFGCCVGDLEIKQAAELDLPDILSVLLRYRVYSEGLVDLKSCSSAVVTVIKDAMERQELELQKLRKEAENFLVSFVRQLVEICFSRRWEHPHEDDLFGRSVIGVLVGNVELCALRQREDVDPTAFPQPEDSNEGSIVISAYGLLQILPTAILGRALSVDPADLTTLLLLTEDFLCSKGVNDGGAGLIILLTLLQRFPSLHQSQDMERYGFAELVASHDALASNKISEISSNAAKISSSSSIEFPQIDFISCKGTIRCPKKHTASLHVTKHASFRCDLCGKGVEKGSIMHGCRQCDWDACEACTDKSEGGLVKWNFIREMASRCQDLLCQDDVSSRTDAMKEDNEWSERMVENLKSMDNGSEVNTLSIRLLQRDPTSIRTLATMLSSRGQITMHQFLMVILPALHSSLLGKTASDNRSKRNRRSKKPRVAGDAYVQLDSEDRTQGSEQERLAFAKEVLKHLVRSPKINGTNFDRSEIEGEATTFRRFDDDEDDDFEGSENEDDDDEDDDEDSSEQLLKSRLSEAKVKSQRLPGLIRRLHQVLALHEDVISFKIKGSSRKECVSPEELRSLKAPIKIHLSQQNQNRKTTIIAEPLATVEDISHQLLRTALVQHPQYSAFCQQLVDDSAVIIERTKSRSQEGRTWRVAKIISYDSRGGWHTVNYATSVAGIENNSQLHLARNVDFARFQYDSSKSKRLVLASREYVVIHRQRESTEHKSVFDMEHFLADGMVAQDGEDWDEQDATVVGMQVQSDFVAPQWQSYTILSRDSSRSNHLYDLVSDDGEVICGVPCDRIRGLGNETMGTEPEIESSASRAERRSAETRQHLSRAFPFLSARRLSGSDDPSASASRSSLKFEKSVLKRTWSALGPIESMRPVEVTAKPITVQSSDPTILTWSCQFGDEQLQMYVESDAVDLPPCVSVDFSSTTTPLSVNATSDTTLVSLLFRINEGEEIDVFSKEGHIIAYSLSVQPSKSMQRLKSMKKSALNELKSSKGLMQTRAIDVADLVSHGVVHSSRSRKLSDSAVYSDEEEAEMPLSGDGLDEICIQCLEIIEFMAEVDNRQGMDKKNDDKTPDIFVNQRLSQKLTEQLDNPLIVVGGAVPAWCLELPSFSPRVFTYASRKLLLERVAFGVSRSTLRQQEAKVNVGRFRQRMTALRARAVELVGEAFSGGAEDPTALQLQADELYGMEEALGARIRQSFRAEGWQEQSIEVAKAAIHRDLLIEDAMSIMEQYSKDPKLNRRRLEVRFDGESGFDAASGDEAGVTRGFYADVAEALLSTDLVAGVIHSLTCPAAGYTTDEMDAVPVKSNGEQKCKLPLWIPDLDSTHKVIIPTPRASPSSIVGIFPRPLSKLHPQYDEVLETFRFMGRLFAAAMRDGFMFPLPLSGSFLRLVQHSGRACKCAASEEGILSSCDLPRPGFTGGEVFAVESYICAALDKIDNSNPPLSKAKRDREYERVASEKTFAQAALGMTYDCSFNDYFEDRVFVDPMDPTQGIEAHPLCQNGHLRQVTIHNVREWVALAKDFMLHDGVIGQAIAFRAGVDDFFSSEYLRLFTSEELQRDVCGVGDNVDDWKESDIRKLFKLDGKGATEALVAVAAIGGNAEALSRRFGPSSPTIKFVIKALLEATPRQRRQFLNFVTSVPIVTPGQIEVVPVVSSSGEFMPMRDPGCLPRANTCARRLYLPKFESYESFKKVLWAVVEDEFKHKGFFEWSL
ncbi:HECT-domain ubiquitin-transferase [Nitzschia inconspicua]|uniref:HECT-domain ubiquitin-transferase n=1 Tax=Nitzschia inconspicua TaxID=303405 RepID=A0A9K3Q6V7_9STRA|nr:HECT-domain ubiquitin-transferase [Nitzschia inconspicua]